MPGFVIDRKTAITLNAIYADGTKVEDASAVAEAQEQVDPIVAAIRNLNSSVTYTFTELLGVSSMLKQLSEHGIESQNGMSQAMQALASKMDEVLKQQSNQSTRLDTISQDVNAQFEFVPQRDDRGLVTKWVAQRTAT